MYCPQCGAAVADGAKFCANCGAGLSPRKATATQRQPMQVPVPAPAVSSPPAKPTVAGGPPAYMPPVPAPSAAPKPAGSTTPARITPGHLTTFGASLGIALGSAIVLALITTLLAIGSFTDLTEQVIADQTSFSYSDLTEIYTPNFFQNLIIALVAGISGEFSFNVSSAMFSTTAASFSLPMSLVGVALFAGAAFGAYMMARTHRIAFRWSGVVSALLVGIASGLVVIILAAIFRISTPYEDTAVITFSGASFRTFALTFLIAAAGALTGHFLADKAPASSNVFLAAWHWAHRARGSVRTIIESAAIFTVAYTVIGIIAICVIASQVPDVPIMSLFPMLLPLAPSYMLVLTSFGGIEANMTSSLPQTLTLFNFDTKMPASMNLIWLLWIIFAVMLVCLLYTAVRAGARNYYDPHYAGWSYCWQAPVFWFVFWLIMPYLTMAMQFHAAGQAISGPGITIMPALWFSLVAAAWALLIEICARLLAPVIIQSAPGMWKCFVGGTVQPETSAPAAAPAKAVPTPGTPIAAPAAVSAPYATPAGAPAAMPATARTMSARQKRSWIVTGIALGAIAVLGITYAILNATMFSATSAGKDYITAIENGDFDRANELANPQLKQDQAKLLTSKAAPGNEGRITNAHVVRERNSGNAKTLTVAYTLDGKQTTRDLKMVKKGSKALVFTDWAIAEPLTTTIAVSYPDAVDEITVNGIAVTSKNAKSSDGESHTFVVYPGKYDVATATSKFYTQETADLVAGADSSEGSAASLNVKATDALYGAINEQVASKLDECAKSKDKRPANCPFSAYSYFRGSDTRNYSWSITEYPEVSENYISLGNGTFSTYDGTAKYTYEFKTSDGWKPESDSTSIASMQGEFTIDGDKITVEFTD